MSLPTDRAARLAFRKRVLAAAAARRPRAAPRPDLPHGAVVAHARLLRAVSSAMDDAIAAALRPAGVRLDAEPSDDDVDDADPLLSSDDVARVMDRLEARLGAIAGRASLADKLAEVFARVARHSEKTWRSQLRAALGVDLAAEPDLARMMAAFQRKNAMLISSLARDKARRVRAVLRDVEPGERASTVAARLREASGITARRAALIATDQVLTLHADVTQARHEAAGIVEFTWSTSRDARVRASHRALEGQRFAYASPPEVDGEPALPGKPIRCRCVAVAVIPGLE